jgi:ABC-type multidrug transport system ATPase subunit
MEHLRHNPRVTLELKSLTKTFPRKKVLSELQLSFPGGKIVAVLGYNGVGKTTLLRTIAAELAPSSGEVLFDGDVLTRQRLDLRRRLILLHNQPLLFGQRDALALLAFYVKAWQAEREDTVATGLIHLDGLGISAVARDRLGELSRGQSYKAALAALMTVDPELWLLDEPFASGMDPQGFTYFKKSAMAAATERGRTIIYTTQLVEIACSFADQIAVIRDGKAELLENSQEAPLDPRSLEQLFEGTAEE